MIDVDKVVDWEAVNVKLDVEAFVGEGFVLGFFEGDLPGLAEFVEDQDVFIALRDIVLKVRRDDQDIHKHSSRQYGIS